MSSTFQVPNDCRITEGPLASTDGLGNHGYFMITLATGEIFRVRSSKSDVTESINIVPCPDKRRPVSVDQAHQVARFFWRDELPLTFDLANKDYVEVSRTKS